MYGNFFTITNCRIIVSGVKQFLEKIFGVHPYLHADIFAKSVRFRTVGVRKRTLLYRHKFVNRLISTIYIFGMEFVCILYIIIYLNKSN